MNPVTKIMTTIITSVILMIAAFLFFLIFWVIDATGLFNGFFVKIIVTSATAAFLVYTCISLLVRAGTSFFPGTVENIGKIQLQFSTIPISILTSFGLAIGIVSKINSYIDYRVSSPLIHFIGLTLLSLIPLLAIKWAIEQVSPTPLKSWNKSLVLWILIIVISSSVFEWCRTDYHDGEGNIKIWTTNSNERFWFSEPIFKHDLDTGQPIRIATPKEVKRFREERRNKSFFPWWNTPSKNKEDVVIYFEDDTTETLGKDEIFIGKAGKIIYYEASDPFLLIEKGGETTIHNQSKPGELREISIKDVQIGTSLFAKSLNGNPVTFKYQIR